MDQTHDQISAKTQESPYPTLRHILDQFTDCADLEHQIFPHLQLDMLYFSHLADQQAMKNDLFDPFATVPRPDVKELLSQSRYIECSDSKKIVHSLLSGNAALFYQGRAYIVSVGGPITRSLQQSETESVITGPHDSFTESLTMNLSLIRRRVKSSHLKVITMSVGEISKMDVRILYIESIANMDFVHQLVERINGIEMDSVLEANMLVQLIDENPNSIFPQFLTSERPDVISSKLMAGRVVGLVDNSPSAFSAPTSFFEFFASPDDYYQRFAVGTSLRVLRFIAFIIAVSFTAFYVSVTTFHYEMIPQSMLLNLATSRTRVPFPPLYEAFLMEITIELLREAGARLPTKIGQTIGIVGGIVIGTAAVQAGLTSNILIIAVALSAIASFVIPSYIMSASIRLIRFGLILLAGIWGNFGLMFGISIIVIHLSGITNLGTSYLTPVAPLNLGDWKDIFIRAPFWWIKTRPMQTKTPNKVRNKMKK
ncbi:spore germination protein [Paenibacillaceae bacterium]|nr:spore germination protein [Paenibacillaceae bacterium]